MSGIIQIVTKGSGDLFLTGNPEITYFKTVYRRHTNFAIELINVDFSDYVGFGSTSTLKIPKVGDLIHKMYLKIKIPSIRIKKELTEEITIKRRELEELKRNYRELKVYFEHIMRVKNIIEELNETVNEDTNINNLRLIRTNMINRMTSEMSFYTEEEETKIINILSTIEARIRVKDENKTEGYNSNTTTLMNNINPLSYTTYFTRNRIEIDNTLTEDDEIKENIINYIDNLKIYEDRIIYNNKRLDKEYIEKIIKKEKEIEEIERGNYKFAWVKRLGHSIIDTIEIYIGGNKIDQQYGTWLDVWHELTGNKKQEKTYKEMIGDIEELTRYDNKEKPEYTLYVPLQFWFNKYIGESLPIVALENNDVSIRVKFRKFSECSYTEYKVDRTEENRNNDLLDNMIENKNINIEASLLVDYIYLDSYERRKFARAGHEYLIEQVQYNYETGIKDYKHAIKLNFNHPCKGYIWYIQREKELRNDDNTRECLWTDYTVNETNPIKRSRLMILDKVRSSNYEGEYYNYVQPYEHMKNTPSDGINSYWFSIYPTEQQPSGTCNNSNIPEMRLEIEVDEYFVENEETYRLNIYAINYNILRIIGGFGNIAYI